MKKKYLRWIQLALVFALAWSIFTIYNYVKKDERFDETQASYLEFMDDQADSTEEDSPSPSTTTEKDDGEMAFEEKATTETLDPKVEAIRDLRKRFPDVIGRIKIEGTVIDYPVVQGIDNEFYLDHNFRGEAHDFGAIFLDADHDPEFRTKNAVLYGHNVRSGKMFDPLAGYKDEAFFKEHPEIELTTLNEPRTYRVFAAFNAEPDAAYRFEDYSKEGWAQFGYAAAEIN